MENINVQVYSLVSEPISPIEKLKTIAKLGFAGAEFTADFTEVPVEEMKKVLAEGRFRSRRSGSDRRRSPLLCRAGRKACHLPDDKFLQQGRS